MANLTRRSLPGGASMLALLGAAVPAKCGGPDRGLITASDSYVARWTARRAEWDGADMETRRRIAAAATADMFKQRPSDDPEWQAAVAISRMPAQTQEGIQAKARVVLCWLRDCGAELDPQFQADSGVAAAWSLVADVLGSA